IAGWSSAAPSPRAPYALTSAHGRGPRIATPSSATRRLSDPRVTAGATGVTDPAAGWGGGWGIDVEGPDMLSLATPAPASAATPARKPRRRSCPANRLVRLDGRFDGSILALFAPS